MFRIDHYIHCAGCESLGKTLAEINRGLVKLKEQIMKSETEVTLAVSEAAGAVMSNVAAALTKEKQEIIDAIKANPPAGISDAGLADILGKIAGIGTASVAGIDKLSVDVTPPAA